MSFAAAKTRIKGISDKRRLPRLNKIRLGFKIKKGTTEYPAELPFFLLPPEVARVYGAKDEKVLLERAKELGVTRADVLKFIAENAWRLSEELEIMFPINEPEAVFPQAYVWYGSTRGAKCKGDGETAIRDADAVKEGNAKEVEPYEGQPEIRGKKEVYCPCDLLKTEANPRGECTQRAHLLVMLPKVNVGGVYQIDIGSYNSIVDINSGIDYTAALIGRFALVPLILRRISTETHHDQKKQTHFTLQVIMNVPIHELDSLRRDNMRILEHSKYMLPAPEEVNPEYDASDVVIEGELEEKKDEPKAETPKETPKTHEERLKDCKTLDELKTLWGEVCSDPELKKKDDATNLRKKALNAIQTKKKKELAEAKKEPVDIEAIKKTIEMAPSVKALDEITEKIPWDALEGEQKVDLMRARDEKATALGAVPEEQTTMENF